MPPRYGYVKGKVTRAPQLVPTRHGRETQYHLHLGLRAVGAVWDVAVNVGTDDPRDLLVYKLLPAFAHPITGTLRLAAAGSHELTGTSGPPALDFVRGDILAGSGGWRRSDVMGRAAATEPATSLSRAIGQAMAAGCDTYVFGRYYLTGLGIHDVHLNQGSTGAYLNPADPDPAVQDALRRAHPSADGNAVWQDGALLIDTGDAWTAYVAAFAMQLLPTNEYGDPAPGATPVGGAGAAGRGQ